MAFKNMQLFDKIAKEVLKAYDFTENICARPIQISENASYLIQEKFTGEKTGVLRISRPGYHQVIQLESEIRWLKQINKEKRLIVPKPIRGRNGQYIHSVKGADNREYHCVLFHFLEGTNPSEEDKEAEEQFYRLGRITAYLHNQTQDWQESKKLNRIQWDYDTIIGEHAAWGPWQTAKDITPEIKALLMKTSKIIRNRLEIYGKDSSRFGLIHGDLRCANLLVEKKQIKVIDFDDCGYGWHLHDLAAAFSFIETKPMVPKLMDSWLKGYGKVRPLAKKDFQEIDTFMMMRRMQLMAWMASHYDSDPVNELNAGFTEETAKMAEKYIRRFG